MNETVETSTRSNVLSVRHLAPVLISFAILGLLLHQVDFHEMAGALRSANWELLLVGVAAYWCGLALRAWRWQLLVNKDHHAIMFGDAMIITLIGCALNVILPASMGDVAKSYYGYRRTGHKEIMLSSSLVDKLIGMLAGFVAGFPLAAWMHLWVYFWVGVTVSAALTAILFFPRMMPWSVLTCLAARVGKRIDASQLVAAATLPHRLLLVSFMLSVLSWVLSYLQVYLTFLAFDSAHSPTLGHVFALIPLVTLTKLLPLTLDGLGPQEGASVYLFGQVGVAASLTLLTTLVGRALASWLPAVVGIVFILRSRRWVAVRAPLPDTASERPA